MLKSFISSMAEIASTSAIVTYLESTDDYSIMAVLISKFVAVDKRLSINSNGVTTYLNEEGHTVVEMARSGVVFIHHCIETKTAIITTTQGGFKSGVYQGDHLPMILSTLAILFK